MYDLTLRMTNHYCTRKSENSEKVLLSEQKYIIKTLFLMNIID